MSPLEGGGRFMPNEGESAPRPTRAPRVDTTKPRPARQAAQNASVLTDAQQRGYGVGNGGPQTQARHLGQSQQQARQRREAKRVNKTKIRNGGGFNPSINPSVNVSIGNRGGGDAGQGQGGGSTAGRTTGRNATPGGDFMSNEDVHAFFEAVRKAGRNRAVERAMDAEHLQAVLERIPTSDGSMAGARMRARRVSRHLRRIARAEKLIARAGAAGYAQFEREYEAELRKVGKARAAQPSNFTF